MILDFVSGEAPSEFASDLCLIGAGAVGIAIGLEFADTLPPGTYRLRAVIDVGAKERLGADVRVTVAR